MMLDLQPVSRCSRRQSLKRLLLKVIALMVNRVATVAALNGAVMMSTRLPMLLRLLPRLLARILRLVGRLVPRLSWASMSVTKPTTWRPTTLCSVMLRARVETWMLQRGQRSTAPLRRPTPDSERKNRDCLSFPLTKVRVCFICVPPVQTTPVASFPLVPAIYLESWLAGSSMVGPSA